MLQLVRQRGDDGLSRDYAWDRAFAPASIADGRWGRTDYVADDAGQIVETPFGDETAERFSYDAAVNFDGFGEELGGIALFQTAAGGRIQRAAGPQGERIFLAYDVRSRVTGRCVGRAGFRPRV